MIFKDFYAGKNDSTRRLDKVLRIFIPETSLSSVYKFLRKGLIKVNDKKSTPDYRLCEGDKISIAEFILTGNTTNDTPHKTHIETIKTTLPPIVFENENIIFFNKPVNMAVHGDNSLEQLYSAYYKETNQNKDSLSFRPGPLHRIDRMTSGLVAFSKSLSGAKWFSEGIKEHSIQKKYYALLEGTVLQNETWIDYIKAPEDNKKGFHTVEISSTAHSQDFQKAISHVHPLAFGQYQNKEVTLVEVQIESGRQHQIRAQSSFHKIPLLGDTAYGGTKLSQQEYFLHAAELTIPLENPISLPEKITAPLPSAFSKFLSKSCNITFSDI